MSNVFQTCLKGFKLKRLVVEPNMAQSIELDKESINHRLNRSRSGSTPNSTGQGSGRLPAQPVEGAKKKLYFSSRTVVQPVGVQRSPTKH